MISLCVHVYSITRVREDDQAISTLVTCVCRVTSFLRSEINLALHVVVTTQHNALCVSLANTLVAFPWLVYHIVLVVLQAEALDLRTRVTP